jgi:SAM-dependent methyltransferase
MKQLAQIIDCYDRTAAAYADKYFGELAHKPLDRLLLATFAAGLSPDTPVLDLGCGPGQTTRFLYDAGLHNLTGIDLSPRTIDTARACNAGTPIFFEVADMLRLPYADASFGGAVAFYAIVHFAPEELAIAFSEAQRVLQPGAPLLLAFHTGEDAVHVDRFLEAEVDVTFYFFEIEAVVQLLQDGGWEVEEALVRYPYVGKEYPSKRAYLVARKPDARERQEACFETAV